VQDADTLKKTLQHLESKLSDLSGRYYDDMYIKLQQHHDHGVDQEK
jgi:hypothetical protein